MAFEEAACEGFKEAAEETIIIGNERPCSGRKLIINTVVYRTWSINVPPKLSDGTEF